MHLPLLDPNDFVLGVLGVRRFVDVLGVLGVRRFC